MTLLRFPCLPILAHPSSSHGSPTLHLRFKPISCASFSAASSSGSSGPIPARDRVIDFGKYRGQMLGTLPFSYLTWVSKNLRSRDYEEWARLADEVLGDPVYRDRLEWESAERVLTGGGLRASSVSDSPVEELLDISERFGWDNEDKEGWRRIDFELLGTSKGGRIPRLPMGDGRGKGASGGQHKGSQLDGRGRGEVRKVGFLGTGSSGALGRREVAGSSQNGVGLQRNNKFGSPRRSRISSTTDAKKSSSIRIFDSSEKSVFPDEDFWVHEAKQPGTPSGRKVGYLSKGFRFTVGEEGGSSVEEEGVGKEKRDQRRDRRRLKREQQMRTLRREVVGLDAGGGDEAVTRGRVGEEDGGGYSNPFPGRGALLDKIRGRGS